MRDQLGAKARDTITGFEGVITGHVAYITGCNQVLIASKATNGKGGEVGWFDEQRVEILKSKRIVLDNSRSPGPDAPAPIR